MDENFFEAKSNALENTRFIHIPGPNPILKPGAPGEWDDKMMEMSSIFRDGGKFYLYYHACSHEQSYRIGVATADNPLGPWKKYEGNPILDIGEPGSWEDHYVACSTIIKEGDDKYYMFYSAWTENDRNTGNQLAVFNVGLATANSPLGPWKKYEGNPIIRDFGYVGGIVKKDGKYMMFNEHHVGAVVTDYGPISLATADRPEGPWTIREEPVLKTEGWGSWDDGGYSEPNVLYNGALFQMFYGGAKKEFLPRLQTSESIGLAYSTDGLHFTKYARNPVIRNYKVPYGAAFAEVCAYSDGALIYLYHTLRYTKGWYRHEAEQFPNVEHIGVEVLAVGSPFALNMPLLTCGEVAPRTTFVDDGLLPVNIENVKDVTLTVSCRYDEKAKRGLKIHVKSSVDGYTFDTRDAETFTLSVAPGEEVRESFAFKPSMHYISVTAENADSNAVSDVSVVGYMRG